VTALDLRGTPCPLNYVRARLALERLPHGAALEVRLDHGEPEDQVPRSLRMDGHAVEVLEDEGPGVRLRVVRRPT
jgi:TusA-related sulfurtransferase